MDCNKMYYGRGPMQLSWDYNYKSFSQYYFKDDRLLNNPALVDKDAVICWASAIWFWMTPQNYGGYCMPQAAWPDFNTCSQQCPGGPVGCSNPICTADHWITPGKLSCHEAI